MNESSVEIHEKQLRARLDYLNARLHRIDDALDEPVGTGEEAVEREDEEVLEDLGAAGLQEIRMIEAALDRIRQGSYGTCAVCGEPIAEERLDAVPHAATCRDCAG
ncbi:TraR/DksA family transcriptional regulator [Amaricoccus solimangrovi]|uniref:TraR/DksA family transcriptional regulator n=1 Tax=Amaricoccus solimangrovi TaxID=2589815 RepID=A0A501WTU5_9RHOB|nr:TraR/DksA C4-type zinc finger protein [Amaricoccus solimangrovi]TPE52202.1 TraR/DksA family transcriptional regulator [Amaricoccus solimangrovi]